jgi:hypothetical protein
MQAPSIQLRDMREENVNVNVNVKNGILYEYRQHQEIESFVIRLCCQINFVC